jgi:hypothetical protein
MRTIVKNRTKAVRPLASQIQKELPMDTSLLLAGYLLRAQSQEDWRDPHLEETARRAAFRVAARLLAVAAIGVGVVAVRLAA